MNLRKCLFAIRFMVVGMLLTSIARAAQDIAPTTLDVGPLIDALVGLKWSAAGAIAIGLVVALAKQGWFSQFIASKLPPVAIPYVAVVLGSLGMVSTQVLAGKPWLPALGAGILAGVLSVFGHETLIEGVRKGKEIIPEYVKKVAPTPTIPAPPPEEKKEGTT
jgi:hypothetical protein